ncbi:MULTISPECIES: hypothetical protein [Methanosarcina]|uniref:Delta-aminolevulinic acid dehydratase n=2 Tax=Methanosarcina barkeri TaxID=2208 RepID=A0A0E3QP84_METBA|nr:MULTISPECIES: hypothetical protein [Methanosarcina]AKB53002.1 hypothetical protein MSBRM_0004 [Methanosarcina barkeri MS]AKB56535.1 hypothetical protein MSBR2_0019 [Methanosarcina barkeri 227]OEC89774.1 hypothetical protein A9239_05465 [Methanosarcina sp. A14]
MTFDVIVDNSMKSLYDWVKSEEYYGWDPYDALNSKIVNKFCSSSQLLEILVTQLNKYSILNIRPIIGVEKGLDVKGMSLFAQSFSKIYSLTNDQRYKEDLFECSNFLKNKSLKQKYGFDCWAGHYFYHRGFDGDILTPEIPDIITTSNVIKAMVDSYLIFKDEALKDIGKSACDFLIKDLLRKTDDGLYYLQYDTLSEDKIVTDASAKGLTAICKLMPLFDDAEMRTVACKLSEFLIRTQDSDGCWIYTKYKSGKIRRQTDFHQGFIIDSLVEYLSFAEPKEQDRLIDSIKRGVNFYRKKQFLDDGRCYYRYPQMYPTDIHNQAQGIITFSKLSMFDPEFLEFARKILEWTIFNMQDNSGYFFYQKNRVLTNKIPYMRWGAAWMMLSMATYLEKVGVAKS